MRLWNVPLRISYAIQAFTALMAALVLLRLCSYRPKAAAFLICGLLATPYLLHTCSTTI